MKKRHWTRIILGIIIALFGALTLFLSSAVLLDLFGVRERESPFVHAVVVGNLIASLLYLPTSYGMLTNRRWTMLLLTVAISVLVASALLLGLHIAADGEYRTATIGALAFRILLTAIFLGLAKWSLSPSAEQTPHTAS